MKPKPNLRESIYMSKVSKMVHIVDNNRHIIESDRSKGRPLTAIMTDNA